jgi:hypothetical protein
MSGYPRNVISCRFAGVSFERGSRSRITVWFRIVFASRRSPVRSRYAPSGNPLETAVVGSRSCRLHGDADTSHGGSLLFSRRGSCTAGWGVPPGSSRAWRGRVNGSGSRPSRQGLRWAWAELRPCRADHVLITAYGSTGAEPVRRATPCLARRAAGQGQPTPTRPPTAARL